MITEYLKRLFSKWLSWVLLIPSILGGFAWWFGYHSSDVFNYGITIVIALWLILLQIASYQVWVQVANEKKELEEKLRNPVDYEVMAKIKKVELRFEDIERQLKIKIECANNGIEDMSIRSHSSAAFYYVANDQDIEHRNRLSCYIRDIETLIVDWRESMGCIANIYHLELYIKNIGNKADEDVDVSIFFGSNLYLNHIYDVNGTPEKIDMPIHPEGYMLKCLSHEESETDYNIDKISMLQSISSMRVGDKKRIIEKMPLLMQLIDKNQMYAEIKSKHSTSIIRSSINFIDDGVFEAIDALQI